VKKGAPSRGSPDAFANAQVPAGSGPVKAVAGSPSGISGAAPPAGDFAWIRDAIQRAIAYPAMARRMGWEGKVVVAFQILADGSVRDVRVVQGSGHAALDRGAIDAVRNASPFHRSTVEAEVITPVVYRLTTR
jgi:protein TonB